MARKEAAAAKQDAEAAEQEAEAAKAKMAEMMPAEEVDATANLTYVSATGDLIRATRHSSPDFNLQPLFD